MILLTCPVLVKSSRLAVWTFRAQILLKRTMLSTIICDLCVIELKAMIEEFFPVATSVTEFL